MVSTPLGVVKVTFVWFPFKGIVAFKSDVHDFRSADFSSRTAAGCFEAKVIRPTNKSFVLETESILFGIET